MARTDRAARGRGDLAEPSAAAAEGPVFPGPCARTEDDDADGTIEARTHYHYDARGHLIREETDMQETGLGEGDDCCLAFVREADGRVDEVIEYAYDEHGRLHEIDQDHNADGSYRGVTVVEYDAHGRERARKKSHVWKHRRPRPGEIRRFVYDGERLVREELVLDDRVVEVTRHEYDTSGRLVRTAVGTADEPARFVTTYDHDDQGRVARETRTDHGYSKPVVRVVTFEHDAAGRVVLERHAPQETVQTKYDAHGNPIQRDTRAGDNVTLRVRWDYGCWRAP